MYHITKSFNIQKYTTFAKIDKESFNFFYINLNKLILKKITKNSDFKE